MKQSLFDAGSTWELVSREKLFELLGYDSLLSWSSPSTTAILARKRLQIESASSENGEGWR